MADNYPYRQHVYHPGERFPRGNWCLHCGAYDDEPAKPVCRNPGWHEPRPATSVDEDGPF